MSKLVFHFLVLILIHQILSIPGNGAKNLFTSFCDGPKYLYKFIALLLKDYYLIPNNNAMKLVCCVPYLLYCLKAVSLRVNYFLSGFDLGCCKCTGRTSSKLDLSPYIVPTEISRILNQLP